MVDQQPKKITRTLSRSLSLQILSALSFGDSKGLFQYEIVDIIKDRWSLSRYIKSHRVWNLSSIVSGIIDKLKSDNHIEQTCTSATYKITIRGEKFLERQLNHRCAMEIYLSDFFITGIPTQQDSSWNGLDYD